MVNEKEDLTEITIEGLHAQLVKIIQQLTTARDIKILDIGCGTGAWLLRLHKLGYTQLFGIDYKQPANIEGINMHRFDINYDSYKKIGKYELITCIEVIEHIENIGHLLNLIKKALTNDGIAIITTPNVESLHARTRYFITGRLPSFDNKGDPTHLFPILYTSLDKIVSKHGLYIREIIQYPDSPIKSLIYSKYIKYLTMFLRLFLSDKMHGDNTIYIIGHAENYEINYNL